MLYMCVCQCHCECHYPKPHHATAHCVTQVLLIGLTWSSSLPTARRALLPGQPPPPPPPHSACLERLSCCTTTHIQHHSLLFGFEPPMWRPHMPAVMTVKQCLASRLLAVHDGRTQPVRACAAPAGWSRAIPSACKTYHHTVQALLALNRTALQTKPQRPRPPSGCLLSLPVAQPCSDS